MSDAEMTINIGDLKEIMDDLDSHQVSSPTERRKHSLTRDDVLIIARIIQATSGQTCSMGLEQDEITTIKRFVSVVNRGAWAIGLMFILSVASIIGTLVALGFKHSVFDIASKGVK